MEFKYRAGVLNELALHGIAPGPQTPPELVHEFVNDLYCFEIRVLKRRMQTGAIAKAGYSEEVSDLRKRYPILSLPIRFWLELDEQTADAIRAKTE